ncbi:TPR repeat-containing protein [Nostoc commune NIES-4072]|uniref:TPR repeat-containing protein n=1 Tax=Nostoc commune NIES-4072 TaxID=2005467 RepID=A0A2R5FIA1_NOSCO|nr:tetratricopeptide repeat protein [Nostoc commune]BBD65578.1 TPR repeat-containing protein [Nostoc commune HK-02]GBG17098.1 TPR repeat-containing protein [Nostoc commune NIES-4072]
MGAEEALAFVDNLVFLKTGEHLDKTQRIILRNLWEDEKRTYQDIADSRGYTEAHLKAVGAELWQLLSKVFESKVSKSTFQGVIQRFRTTQQSQKVSQIPNLAANGTKPQDLDSNFVGRDRQIAELHTLVNRGQKVILIQGEGGIGKTRLARKYFKSQKFNFVLELWMATEIQNLTPVESVVEEWLRRYFNEEPGGDFGISLERLRRKLREQTSKIGVFIDNLETALDQNGKFLEYRRPYVELLRVLADSDVHSVTLVTSRERLRESSVEVHLYPLEGLDDEAWREFFSSCHINCDCTILSEMCRAYGGNAKAMQILRGAILTDFSGDIHAYWQENCTDLLMERELKDLVASQFNRLQKNDLEAYRLLCRLGCYRYQDIPSLPIEGVLCLLWDVPEKKRRGVIKALQDLSLIEAKKGQYWLHPVIQYEAISRLRLVSEEWELVNRKAAEYWTQRVTAIKDITDALTALEAYYHYVEINDFEQAGDVILQGRGEQWTIGLPLGCSFYQLGLLQKNFSVIKRIIDDVKSQERLIKLYNILGYTYRIIGCIREAIDCYKKSEEILDTLDIKLIKISMMFNTGLCKLDLLEMEAAEDCFKSVCNLAEQDKNLDNYMAYAQCCLALVKSCSNFREEAFYIAEDALSAISSSTKVTLWGMGHSLINLCLTYKNLGNIKKSFELCQRAISSSEENNFTQLKAKAITCLAGLYREEREFARALFHHAEAIEILNKIGAKSNLAEAYYQLALTYQQMGEIENSKGKFMQAIALFNEMQAPKQVEKVQTAMECFEK